MAANIQAYLENLRQPWGQIYYDILFEQLQDIKGKRVLDFGSGFGLVANHLAQDNEVLAVEPNEEIPTSNSSEVWTSWQVLKRPALMSSSVTMSWSM